MADSVTVLTFLNEVSPTSIPLEIAEEVDAITPAEVIVASFYDGRESITDDVCISNVQLVPLGASSRFDIRAYRRLREIAVERDVNILHTHHNSTGSFARLALTSTDIGVINTEHRNHESFNSLQIFTNCLSYPSIDHMIANSNQTAKSYYWYERRLLSRSECTVVYNGVDIDRINSSINPAPTGGDDIKTIVSVGRLINLKNQKTLIRAFNDVQKTFPNSNLVIVGDGPLRKELEGYSESIGVADSVDFTGLLPRESVYEILHRSTIFALPSRSEGFCVAAVEAMACGLPVVGSDIDVLHEVLGDHGIFFPPDDPEALSEEIIRLLANDDEREKIGQELKCEAEAQFPIERTAQEYYKIYKRLAEQSE